MCNSRQLYLGHRRDLEGSLIDDPSSCPMALWMAVLEVTMVMRRMVLEVTYGDAEGGVGGDHGDDEDGVGGDHGDDVVGVVL